MSKLFTLIFFIHLAGCQPVFNDQDHKDIGFTARKIQVKGNYTGFKKLVHDINVGSNNFNLEYGFFRAEKSGMYTFSFQMISTEREHFRVSLRINGRPMIWAFANRRYQQAGNTGTFLLNRGDVVYLYLEEGAIFEPASYRGYGTFSGHRISYDEPKVIVPRISATRTSVERTDVDDYKTYIPNFW